MKEKVLNTYYYYERSKDNRPTITNCLLIRRHPSNVAIDWARGTAICSPVDMPCKEEGRDIAFSRAVEALLIGEDIEVEPYMGKPENRRCDPSEVIGTYMPLMTEIEKKLSLNATE